MPRPDRRVLVLTQDFALCGAQHQALELSAGLLARGYDVRVGVLRPGGPLEERFRLLDVPIVPFARRWRWDLRPAVRLATYLRRERIDIVHSLLFLPNFYARLAGRVARTPVIVSSLRSTGIEGWHRYAIDVATARLAHVVIANSEAGRADYLRRGGPAERLVVVRNGMRRLDPAHDPEASQRLAAAWGLERFETVIGMVASMEARKDQALLARAVARLAPRHPHTGLVFVGDGSRRAALERLVADLGLRDRVVFAGWLADAAPAYALFDVYVQASAREEGTSNSILEAMVYALPVVATDVGGNAEVVIDGVTGHVVPAGDDARLGERLGMLLDDAGARRRLGANGRARARADFSVERLVSETEAVYERVRAGAPRRAA